jgi:hypothetical protein
MINVEPSWWISPTWKFQQGNPRPIIQRYLNQLGRKHNTHVVCDCHLDIQMKRLMLRGEQYPDAHLVIGVEDGAENGLNTKSLRDEWFSLTGNARIKVGYYDWSKEGEGNYCFSHYWLEPMIGCPHRSICRRKGCKYRNNKIRIDKRNFKIPA